jgi:hypothetical protein
MQRNSVALLAGLFLLCASICGAELNMDWAYHNAAGADRTQELVPGQGVSFLGHSEVSIPDAEPVTLYVTTANQFAGDADEQVFVRWWNGKEEKWITGNWVTNVWLGSGENDAGRFHGQPMDQSVMLDVWEFEIGADVTLPGENFYVVQLKGWKEGSEPAQAYLLKDAGADSKVNNLGQVWTAGDYFQHDWSVTIQGESSPTPVPAASTNAAAPVETPK